MSLVDPSPGGSAWSHCLVPGWAITWPGPPDGMNTVIGRTHRRPTPRRLARYSAAQTSTPPTESTILNWLNTRRPPWPSLRGLPHLWRHWRWWRKNLTARRLRRGDLHLHAQETIGDYPPIRAQLNLTYPPAYAQLITMSLYGPVWTRHRLRRRHLTITTAPPTGPARRLLWTHHTQGNLTWAPPPPLSDPRTHPLAVIALLALMILLAPFIILTGPFGLALAYAAGRLISTTTLPRRPVPGAQPTRSGAPPTSTPTCCPAHPAHAAVRPTARR